MLWLGIIWPGDQFTEYPVPTPGSTPQGMTLGPDGAIWFTESGASQIGRVDATGAITEFPTPTAGSSPWGITAGSDGNLWFTESAAAGKIGRITPSGTITEFVSEPGLSSPITSGPGGNLWYGARSGSQQELGEITTAGVNTYFPYPGSNHAGAIVAGPDGNLWFTLPFGAAKIIGTMTPSGVFSSLSIAPLDATSWGITVGLGWEPLVHRKPRQRHRQDHDGRSAYCLSDTDIRELSLFNRLRAGRDALVY